METSNDPCQSPKAFILKIPDEILQKVYIQLFREPPQSPSREHRESYLSDRQWKLQRLTLVCRRFHRFFTSHLYSMLSFEWTPALRDTNWSQLKTVKLLHRSLKEDPSLALLCHTLYIDFYDPSSGSIYSRSDESLDRIRNVDTGSSSHEVLSDLIPMFTATKKLVLGTSMNDWPKRNVFKVLSSTLSSMQSLTELNVHNHWTSAIGMPLLVDSLSEMTPTSALRKFSIRHITESPRRKHLLQSKLEVLAGTASITELEITDCMLSTKSLKALLKWPARLEKLTIQCDGRIRSLGSLAPELTIHKDSLTSIDIGGMVNGSLEDFDLSDFHSLKELYLAAHPRDTIKRAGGVDSFTDTTFVSNLLAPNLEMFLWDFERIEEGPVAILYHFGSAQERWLRALANAAAAKQSSLRQIWIRFHPEKHFSFNIGSDMERDPYRSDYPWDRIKIMENDFRELGIELYYYKPTIPRIKYLKLVEGARSPSVFTTQQISDDSSTIYSPDDDSVGPG